MPHDVRAPSIVIFATRLCSRHNLSTDARCITPCVGATDIWHSGVPLTFAEITKLWIEPITLGTVKKTRKNGKHAGANAQFGKKVRKSR